MNPRIRGLADGLQVALVPCTAVLLAQTWIVRRTGTGGYAGTSVRAHTGWHGLTDSVEGVGWFLLVPVVVGVAAVVADRRWARVTALVVAALGALALLVTLLNGTRLDTLDATAAAWTGDVLVWLAVGAQAVALASRE